MLEGGFVPLQVSPAGVGGAEYVRGAAASPPAARTALNVSPSPPLLAATRHLLEDK